LNNLNWVFGILDWSPIWLTFKLAAITSIILLILCLPIAHWLSQSTNLLKIFLEVLFTIPLFLPPSVLGFYLLIAFSPNRGLGKWLMGHFNLSFVFSFEGLILASILYNLPFMIGPLKSGFMLVPDEIKEASYSLGKSKWTTFYKIILPNSIPSIITGMIQTFAHTLGEFGVVLMIGGNIPGITRVASIAIYDSVENLDYPKAQSYALILFSITFILVFLIFLINRNFRNLAK